MAACEEQTPDPPPAKPLATCDDSAIRLLDRDAGIHGAIVADTLHMGGAEAPVTCVAPEDLALLARLSIPDDWMAQVQQPQQSQQSQYYLIVIRYPDRNFLYVVRHRDGTRCVVNTIDECVARVTVLPVDFNIFDLPPDVPPRPPGDRPSPPPPGESSPPPGGVTAPAAAGNPQPRDGATGVAVETLLLIWSAADRAAGYDVYWGPQKSLAADADLETPIETTFTAVVIRRPGATAAERRLALGTTYYWRVDAKNDYGTTKGSVWSFTTAAGRPRPPGGGGYTPPVVPSPGGYTPPVVPPPGGYTPPDPPDPPGGGGYTPPVVYTYPGNRDNRR